MRESQYQIAIFRWANLPYVVNTFPEIKLLHHIKNETKGGARQVMIDKANGVKKGVPDLCLPVARRGFNGLYIELKTETGRLSSEQKWWGEELKKQGYCWRMCRGCEAAIKTLEWYLSSN